MKPRCECPRCGASVPFDAIEAVPGPEGKWYVCRTCAAERNGLVKTAVDNAQKLWASRS